WGLLETLDPLAIADRGATVLLNSPHPADEVWDKLPAEVQGHIVAKGLSLWAVDAASVAREAGIPGRINTVMQACFFSLSGVLPHDEAVAALEDAIRHSYGPRGESVVERNLAAVRASLSHLVAVPVGDSVTADRHRHPAVSVAAPDFVQRITARMLAGEGDLLPVSALPPDGTFPTATSQWEKRAIALEVPVWEPDLCIDCGKCAIVCPHAAIRLKAYAPSALDGHDGLPHKEFRSREVPGMLLTVQVSPDDCTGCGVCVQACPAHDKSSVKRKSINMRPWSEVADVERERWASFLDVESADPSLWDPASVKTSQLRRPLFEFSGACAGCGETPYIKLLTQLFGDHAIIANATGCSSIYGGNLPTTPYAVDEHGRGPAWANSLFEDNAEFGLGIRLAVEAQRHAALDALESLRPSLTASLGSAALDELLEHVDDGDEAGIRAQRDRVEALVTVARTIDDPRATRLVDLANTLVRRSVWIVGGDGWAYDIGAGGLDHVLGSGRDVNILVLDTEVYSNTGGQASKATPRGAVAKFAASGKGIMKKDLGLEAMSYGDVYVAKVALGASDVQTVKALLEAEAHRGVSLVIAYSTCIAHGFDMSRSMTQQKLAVQSGHWPLYRYQPSPDGDAQPFHLDSAEPSVPYHEFTSTEARFSMLTRADPERAAELGGLAQDDVTTRWSHYSQLQDVHRPAPGHAGNTTLDDTEEEP
ncbi:MAG: hypothetical protein RJB65_1333, partial [Actinomycetota bacterium]